jgi:hypothetical protein
MVNSIYGFRQRKILEIGYLVGGICSKDSEFFGGLLDYSSLSRYSFKDKQVVRVSISGSLNAFKESACEFCIN